MLSNKPTIGRITIRIAKPFTVNDYINTQITHRSSARFAPRTNPQHRHQLAKMLGYRILEDINERTLITPTALVATILLASRGRGINR